jgi:MoaA/NifB/PqqE/SkfB family radical SAM enzyme
MPNELGTREWKRAIAIAQEHGAKSSLFTGGEVLVREDSPEIIDYSLEEGLETSILTNGYQLREMGKGFINNLRRVQISMDSASPLTHDTIRGKGSWYVARDAIDFARSSGIPVEISATITGDRIEELEGICGIAYSTGSKVLVRPLQPIGRAVVTGGKNTIQALEEKTRQLKDAFGEIFIVDFAKYVPVLGQNHDNTVIQQGFVTVLPDGTIRGTNKKILQLERTAA